MNAIRHIRSGRRNARRTRTATQWTATALALLLVPKCIVCLAAYFAAGAGIGLAGVELCGGDSAFGSLAGLNFTATDAWIYGSAILALVAVVFGRRTSWRQHSIH